MQLILKQIRKSFDSKEVLRDCTYTFEQGRIYGLLGRNGAGKTTLFKTIYGEYDEFSGTALLAVNGGQRKTTGDDIGMVFSQPMIPDFLTGREFIRFYVDVHGETDDGVAELFERLGFSVDDPDRLIKGYSSGMKAKLYLMTLLISKPPVMLLDEPLTSLDVIVANEIKKSLLELREEHIILFSTHIMQLAKDMCDEIVLLKDGVLEGLTGLDKTSPEYEEEIIRHLVGDEK